MDNKPRIKKGYYRTWQIYYNIVFPVKYRKSLLDEEVVTIIRKTAAGIEERYEIAIEIETMGIDRNHMHFLEEHIPNYLPHVSSRSLQDVEYLFMTPECRDPDDYV